MMNRKEMLKQAKNCSVMSVAEIALAYQKPSIKIESFKISNSGTVYKFFMDNYYDYSSMKIKEYFYILLLNRSNRITSVSKISEGGINGTTIDIRLIASTALLQLSSSVIAIHNHPSGNKSPSESDKIITNKISKALILIDVKLLDHLIITENDYYSMADADDM